MSVMYKNPRLTCIEIKHFCLYVHNLHPGGGGGGGNFHNLESSSKFIPGCKFLKHRSQGQKYIRGAKCAHEHGFRGLLI